MGWLVGQLLKTGAEATVVAIRGVVSRYPVAALAPEQTLLSVSGVVCASDSPERGLNIDMEHQSDWMYDSFGGCEAEAHVIDENTHTHIHTYNYHTVGVI